MSQVKSYLNEAIELINNHPNWSPEHLTQQFMASKLCDEGTAIYFVEQAMDLADVVEPIYSEDDDNNESY